jgi:hypothetical protein
MLMIYHLLLPITVDELSNYLNTILKSLIQVQEHLKGDLLPFVEIFILLKVINNIHFIKNIAIFDWI